MQLYATALLKLLLPAALIISAYAVRPYLQILNSETRILIESLPYLVCALAAMMAYLFNRCRLLLAAIGVAFFYWSVRRYLQVSLDTQDVATLYLAISLVCPVLGLYLLALPERGLRNMQGLAYTGGFILLAVVVLLIAPLLPALGESAREYYAHRPTDGYVLSVGATALAGLVVVLGVVLILLRNEDTEAALLGGFAGLYLTLAMLHKTDISLAMGIASGLCLVWGVLRSSYAMAYRDELTGLPGRRALNERLKMLGSRYVIAMLDVDHFKRFNDTHGHDVGDEVLRLVASRFRRVGGGGKAYRYGGEEFCIVFARKELSECVEHVNQVRDEIANYRMSIRDRTLRPVRTRHGAKRRGATRLGSSQVAVTVSAGLAERSEEAMDVEAVIAAADDKLYRAKRAGRNRVAS